MDDHQDHLPSGRHERKHQYRLYQRKLKAAHRLAIALKWVWVRRYQFEQRLILQDVEPRFRVSWKELREIADNPRLLLGGFGKFMHRLHRLARRESDEAVRAYHAVSRKTPQPEPTAQNEPPREES